MGAGDQAAGGAGWVWGPLRGSRTGPARLPQQIQESGGPLVELLAASVSGGPLASSSAVPAWSLGGVLLQWASVESRRWTGPEDTPSSGCVRLGRPPPPGSHPRRVSLVVSAKPRLVFVDRPLPHPSEAPPGWVAPVLQKRKLKLRRVTWVRMAGRTAAEEELGQCWFAGRKCSIRCPVARGRCPQPCRPFWSRPRTSRQGRWSQRTSGGLGTAGGPPGQLPTRQLLPSSFDDLLSN